MEPTVVIKKSKRKTLSLSVTKELQVLVRAPRHVTNKEIDAFVMQYKDWIATQVVRQKEREKTAKANALSADEIRVLKHTAKTLLPARVAHYSKIMGVMPTGVKITSATTRWGSCSAKDSLCFSYHLARLPEDLIDYVVVHELSHIRQKNHGPLFYAEVDKVLPDYKARQTALKAVQKKLGL